MTLMIYQLLMTLFSFIYFPLVFFRALRLRDKNYFLHRLGLNLKDIKRRGVGGIWFHAVSVGETKALSGLIKLFKEKYPALPILISSQTPLGHATAKKLYPEALHFYMPFDCILIMRPLLKALLPKFLIFSETDWWFQLLKEAKRVQARTFIVSAKISERSTKRYEKFKWAHLFKNVDGIIC